MICARCGRASAEGASFCWNCGTALQAGTAVPGPPVPEPAPEGAVVVPAAPWPRAFGSAPSPWSAGETPVSGPWREPEGPEPPPDPWAESPAAAPHEPWAPDTGSPAFAHEPWTTPPGGGTVGPFAVTSSSEPQAAAKPAGFWRRFWAAWLDGMIVWALSVPFVILWLIPHLIGAAPVESWGEDERMAWASSFLLYWMASFVIETLYFTLLESSRHRATLGRIVLGIEVTDVAGGQISFGRALGRRLARIVSGFMFGIGFLVMLFNERRQTLHDLMAGTLVVRRRT